MSTSEKAICSNLQSDIVVSSVFSVATMDTMAKSLIEVFILASSVRSWVHNGRGGMVAGGWNRS